VPFETMKRDPSIRGVERNSANLPKPLVVAILDGPDEREGRTTAIVGYPFKYIHTQSGAEIDVPMGLITDFASIPALARSMFPPFGRHAKAAVLHDWLYLIGEPGQRKFADRIFLDAMTELEVSHARRTAMYSAVRLGGASAYDKEPDAWDMSFGDWLTGDRIKHPFPPERYFQKNWQKPPRPEFKP